MVIRKRRVRVHQKDGGPTIDGIQVSRSRHDLFLLAGELVLGEGKTEPLEGRIAIPVSNILFKQELTT